MEAIKTERPTFTPNRRNGGKRDNRSAQQPRSGPSYRELKQKVETLEKATNSLQSTQEIKYLKKQIEQKNKTISEFAVNIAGLIGGLKALGVPDAVIKKLQDRQPVTADDLGKENICAVVELIDLITPTDEAAEQ